MPQETKTTEEKQPWKISKELPYNSNAYFFRFKKKRGARKKKCLQQNFLKLSFTAFQPATRKELMPILII